MSFNDGSALSAQEVYYFGIIDILTTYDLKKRGEHVLKSIVYDKVPLVFLFCFCFLNFIRFYAVHRKQYNIC